MGASPRPLIVCGATATGKSSYAFNLAKDYKKEVNILSVDSRQLYKDLPIVTGQDNLLDIPSNVELFGQGILKPNEASNIGDFKKYADQVIEKSQKENKKLILVGGTGLYLKAITENLTNTQVPPDEVFRKEADNLSITDLQNILNKLNPILFNSLNNSDANNPRRLIRHIEISRHCESRTRAEAISPLVIPGSDPESSPRHCESRTRAVAIQYQWLCLRKSPENLLKSIKERVISRLNAGAAEEVQNLLKNYPNTNLPIYSTLGVKEIIRFLNKEIPQEELIKLWTTVDNNYAKRQIVWFKKQPNIVWYDIDI